MKRGPVGLALGLVMLGTACAGTQDQPAMEQPSADHNEADVTFVHGMIPHHRQAIEMSEMALRQAASQEVKDLASRIKSAQESEITTMTDWLEDWGQTMSPEHAGHGASGMLSEAEMAQLRQASGAEFDRLFLEGMIRHHEGAVTMAQEELDKGHNPEAKELARHIIDSQQAEIGEMRRLLQR